jgi:hypothetical protein
MILSRYHLPRHQTNIQFPLSISLNSLTHRSLPLSREQLREQHELTQEIGNAITSMPIAEPVDEDELEAELQTMEQEKLDADMLKTGTMPVTSPLNRLPNGPKGESKLLFSLFNIFHLSGFFQFLYCFISSILKECQRIKLIFLAFAFKVKRVNEEEDEEAELAKLQKEMAM